MFRLLAASLMVAAAVPAMAQTTSSASPTAQDAVSTDKSDARRIVCKKEETIGSRLAPKKVCLTVQEWKERADYHRDATERIQHATPVTPSG
jgi:hypothetical protein